MFLPQLWSEPLLNHLQGPSSIRHRHIHADVTFGYSRRPFVGESPTWGGGAIVLAQCRLQQSSGAGVGSGAEEQRRQTEREPTQRSPPHQRSQSRISPPPRRQQSPGAGVETGAVEQRDTWSRSTVNVRRGRSDCHRESDHHRCRAPSGTQKLGLVLEQRSRCYITHRRDAAATATDTAAASPTVTRKASWSVRESCCEPLVA